MPLPIEPPTPFDIDTIEPPRQAIMGRNPRDEPDFDWVNRPRVPANSDPKRFDQLVLRTLGEELSPAWKPEEIHLDDGRILVFEST